ncbi:MAG: HD domain-containing protein [Coriobacteriales bacterium]|jgi:dGTPase|nr:HD domain-containing protein [Coriobacteriales bacterium]
MAYRKLAPDIVERIERDRSQPAWHNPWRTDDAAALRRDVGHDKATLWRPAFVRDAEKVLHSPYYNRLSDKTQVFSLYRNDDLTRRSLHVQLVSRIARSIGAVLGLNTDLIEAIALGHDIGHTPFGHTGERFLSALYNHYTGRFFDHNVHGVRVLDGIFRHNLSLQTLSGVLCHNGEFEQQEYHPRPLGGFGEFDALFEQCCTHELPLDSLVPSTLEGCVVRVSDMIAYVGKDRQDAERAVGRGSAPSFGVTEVGAHNAEIINNLTVDLIENSYGKNHLLFSKKAFSALRGIKQENFQLIYDNEQINRTSEEVVEAMFTRLYERLRADVIAEDESSYVFRHHIVFIERRRGMYRDALPYHKEAPDQIVVDYLASMTDDYFVDLHALYFPRETAIEYVPYFKP